MPDQNLVRLRKATYLRMIENAPGTRLFASLFMKRADTGEEFDALRDGELSCAAFVSSVLWMHGLLDGAHATVATVRAKMPEHGWIPVDMTKPDPFDPGDVVFWEGLVDAGGESHEHVGFVVASHEAVSNSAKERQVVRHHLTYGETPEGAPVRRIIAAYRHAWA